VPNLRAPDERVALPRPPAPRARGGTYAP
jgi:hypothetical protein